MDRKTFVYTLGAAGAVGVGLGNTQGEWSSASVPNGTSVGPDDTVILQLHDGAMISDNDRDRLEEEVKEALGCGKVIFTQGVDAIHVVKSG